MLRRHRFVSSSIVMMLSGTALAQVDPLSGIDFVTIGDVGNPNWTGGGTYHNNRGRVDYEYKIGKFEVTTSQWVEFVNAALDRPPADRIPWVVTPFGWGATSMTPLNSGGRRYRVLAGGEMIPAGGITWRSAAVYCNWLHNGKSFERSAFLNGAYDISTFDDGPTYTDQVTRSPGAQYWIPSLDEWMKAAHWDPVKANADGAVGGWWFYSNRSDTAPVYGPPGVLVNGRLAEANSNWSDFNYPGYNPFTVPLGAYPQTMSAYGLLDLAGGTSEWLEETFVDVGETYFRARYFDGSPRDSSPFGADRILGMFGGEAPLIPLMDTGLRIAASIPAPGVLPGLLILGSWTLARSRRRPPQADRKPPADRRRP